MSWSKAMAVVGATALAVGIGACSSDDGGGDGTLLAMAGNPALGATGGIGGAGGGAGGAAGGAGSFGTAGSAGLSGAGGSGGLGGGGGGGSMAAGTGGSGGSDAGADLPTGAIAHLMGLDGQTLHGTAMFTQSGMDVGLVITLSDCMNGIYPVHIHEGTSCADEAARGMHWETVRGEGIPAIVCDGGSGIQTHARMAGVPETTWSIATDAADDIIGHVVVVHGATAQVACGVIEAR